MGKGLVASLFEDPQSLHSTRAGVDVEEESWEEYEGLSAD